MGEFRFGFGFGIGFRFWIRFGRRYAFLSISRSFLDKEPQEGVRSRKKRKQETRVLKKSFFGI